MRADELTKYAQIIDDAKKEQRRKKLELNKVKVIEEKQIEKQANPIVKAINENKDGTNPEDLLQLQDEFVSLHDKNSQVKYRFNNLRLILGQYIYKGSNTSKHIIKVQNLADSSKAIVLELPNDNVFQIFFKSLRAIAPSESDVNQYIDIVRENLGDFNAGSLLDYIRDLKASRVFTRSMTVPADLDPAPVKRVKVRKPKIRPLADMPAPPPAGDPGDAVAGMGLKNVVIRGSSGIQRGKHGNLLYNNTTLMKKLQLMLSAQEAGNDGMKKDIALFLDEALKRHLIAEWEHKHNMKIFVLSKNKRSKGNQ